MQLTRKYQFHDTWPNVVYRDREINITVEIEINFYHGIADSKYQDHNV